MTARRPSPSSDTGSGVTPVEVNAYSAVKLPREWSLVPLGALCSFANGVNADKSAYGAGVPFINVLEVITHTHIHEKDIPGRVRLSKSRLESFAVRRGDVLFNRTSETQEEVGLSAVYDDDATVVFGGFVIRGRFIDGSMDSTYVGYGFRTSAVRAQIVAQGQGAIHANIGQTNLKRVLIPVPPKPEQRAIAEALSDVDVLLGALESLMVKKRAIKKGGMQQLLTGKTRLPGFSGEWKAKQLGDVGTFSKGRGIKRDQVSDDGLPCIRYGELYTRYENYVTHPVSRIPQAVAAGALPIKTGDLLFAGSGETAEEIGRCAAYLGDAQAYAGGDIVVFSPARQNSIYLGHLMNHPSVALQKARFGQGYAVVHISARNLAQLKIDLPPEDEQTAIATVLSDMDAEIAALERRQDKTRGMKQGMMQQLLTGRVRLVNTPQAKAGA